MEPKHAIATSLLVVGVTSAIAAITHARAGRVRWRVAVLFGLVAMAGAYTGGLAGPVHPRHRSAGGVRGDHDRRRAWRCCAAARTRLAADGDQPLPVVRIALLGIAVGLISGLVGAGGGFLLVPALALLAGLPMPVAVGTSLVVISMQSFAGFAGHLATEQIDWRLAAFVTAAAVVGALIGGRLIAFVNPGTLRQTVRVVRPADGLGDPGRRGQPGGRRCRRGPDAGRRRHVDGLHPIRALPTAPAHRASGPPPLRLTCRHIPPRVH